MVICWKALCYILIKILQRNASLHTELATRVSEEHFHEETAKFIKGGNGRGFRCSNHGGVIVEHATICRRALMRNSSRKIVESRKGIIRVISFDMLLY